MPRATQKARQQAKSGKGSKDLKNKRAMRQHKQDNNRRAEADIAKKKKKRSPGQKAAARNAKQYAAEAKSMNVFANRVAKETGPLGPGEAKKLHKKSEGLLAKARDQNKLVAGRKKSR